MDWIAASPQALGMVAFTAATMYAALIIMTRVAGVRSFSKMSGFDFAVTVSIGSVLASVILTPDPPLAQGVMGLAVLFVLQMSVAWLRVHSDLFEGSTNNKPRLIMANGEMLRDQMAKAKITESDLRGKLREANVLDVSQVDAAVAETTGDISVLHRERGDAPLSPGLLDGVIDAHRYQPRPVQA
ncbi:DUF421 domain-containing protein [Hyphomonas johnsonii]|uniref:YetF C-terminal domain-containing protein n=1 Tax=Hyphomonas johnsonii MHS-2 TaxID=1280950 RepID=A0A059FMA6_9PROT|nr:YetF domain-containing protein [Hyphomonas johnsonii]KCZ91656.1 hypothetical protein HJO_11082 [Hyphomonas johnsonii MHS-2]